MKKAVFLDRDGTINVDTGYLSDPDGLVIIRGAKKGIKLLKKNGFMVFIITNQSGVGRGYFSLEQLASVNQRLLEELSKDGIEIDDVRFCPHHPQQKCACRKPEPGLVVDLIERYGVDAENSYFVGDKMLDVKTGKNVGCRTILISDDSGFIFEEEDDWTPPDFIAKNLHEGAKWIIKDLKNAQKQPAH